MSVDIASWLTFMRAWGGHRVCLALSLATLVVSTPVSADYASRLLEDAPLGYWRLNDQRNAPASNLGTRGDAWNGRYVNIGPGAAGPSELADGTPLFGMGRANVALDTGAPNTFLTVDQSILSGLSEFTISAWVNPRELSGGRLGLVGQHQAIAFGFGPDSLQVESAGGGEVTWVYPDEQVPVGHWFHAAAVGTGDGLQLYFNGDLVQTGGTSITNDYGRSNAPFYVGGGGIFDGVGNEFRGTLDEIAVWDVALSGQQIRDHFDAALAANAPGDYNGNGEFDVDDVNRLLKAIFEDSDDSLFDHSNDGFLDEDDLAVWVNDIRLTWLGDANLDGEFNSSDFVHVFTAGEYEDAIEDNSGWDEGDWNADLDFNSRDLVDALAEGGFENGPITARSVPEPSRLVWGLLLAGVPSLSRFRRADHRCRPASTA